MLTKSKINAEKCKQKIDPWGDGLGKGFGQFLRRNSEVFFVYLSARGKKPNRKIVGFISVLCSWPVDVEENRKITGFISILCNLPFDVSNWCSINEMNCKLTFALLFFAAFVAIGKWMNYSTISIILVDQVYKMYWNWAFSI